MWVVPFIYQVAHDQPDDTSNAAHAQGPGVGHNDDKEAALPGVGQSVSQSASQPSVSQSVSHIRYEHATSTGFNQGTLLTLGLCGTPSPSGFGCWWWW